MSRRADDLARERAAGHALDDRPTEALSSDPRDATVTLSLTHDEWARIHGVVAEALAAPPDERLDRLRTLCGDDLELFTRVRRVLDGVGATPADGDGDPTPPFAGLEPSIGDRVGPYRVVEEIGRGGMGTVYLAERDDVGKRVALKLVTSWASRERMDRLLAERRILARLDHPNIAQLLDAGRTGSGVPYFAMEHVDGEPIDRALERQGADLGARVDALIEVCRAVHFAHQRAIVHRDLKPSNILLDRDGRVKLLDFGIAKIDESIDESTDELSDQLPHLTRTGVRLLTPAWASPEQVRGETVTTASDIYSLGVIAYHLLSGVPPYPTLRTPAEAESAVLQHHPRPPSRRAADAPTAAGTLDPSAPRAEDLDAICLQALRKEPARRYASAAQMADDLEAYRRGLPVSARGDSAWYRGRRFLERHRGPVAAALAAIVVLVAWAISSGLQAERLERERDRARLETAKARTVSDFLIELFRLSDPEQARGEEPSAGALLERGAARIADEMVDQPELQIELMEVLGRVYHNLGRADRSAELFEGALDATRALPGDRRADEAFYLLRLAEAQLRHGVFEPALENTRAALELRLEAFGDDSEPVTDAREELAQALIAVRRPDEAEEPLRRAIAWREQHDPHSEALANSYRFLGEVLSARGESDEALEALERARTLFAALDRSTVQLRAQALVALARLGLATDRLELADEAFDEAREIVDAASLDKPHPILPTVLFARVELAERRGELGRARELARRAVDVTRTIWGDEHPKLGMGLLRLANLQARSSETDEASTTDEAQSDDARSVETDTDALYEEAIAIMAARLSSRHPHLAAVRMHQARFRFERDRFDDALASSRDAFEIRRDAYGLEHQKTAEAQLLVARSLAELGRRDEARPLLDEAITTFESLGAAEQLALARAVRDGSS